MQPEMLDANLLLQTSNYQQHLVLSTPQHELGLEHQPNIQISKAGAKSIMYLAINKKCLPHQTAVLLVSIPEEPLVDHDPQRAVAQ